MKRRSFVKAAGLGLAGLSSLPGLAREGTTNHRRSKREVDLIGTARNVIFVHLVGGASHVDTFDLKTGSWTPNQLGAGTIGNGINWSLGTMPELASRFDKFALLRSISATERVHTRATFQMVTGYQQKPTSEAFAPHIGSLLSYYLSPQRESDLLPYGITFKGFTRGNQRLNQKHRLTLTGGEGNIANLVHRWDNANERFDLLKNLLPQTSNHPSGAFTELHRTSVRRSSSEELLALSGTEGRPEMDDEIAQSWVNQCFAAARLIGSNLGTRFAELQFQGWDNHTNIYSANSEINIFRLNRAMDQAISFLLDELESRPAIGENAANLLEETLVVVGTEFGRTPGDITSNGGREHYSEAFSFLLAGGGVRGGQVIGATDERGSYITDPGWGEGRYIDLPDVAATIYSAMGIDWQQGIQYLRNGQMFPLVEASYQPNHIETLFRG